ncbi:MAG: hypothetical protein SW833_04295 [Cyanobacteriota bacterium]|nr:hypothetical protein [Cyanobacteriota bacterium]
MIYFSGNDLKLIESLVYDSSLDPSYEILKNTLIWNDERPDGLTPEGYEKLCDLWIARSFIHRKIPFSDWDIAPKYFEQVWSKAQKQGFRWPGFYRLSLNKQDREYYENSMSELRKSDAI